MVRIQEVEVQAKIHNRNEHFVRLTIKVNPYMSCIHPL